MAARSVGWISVRGLRSPGATRLRRVLWFSLLLLLLTTIFCAVASAQAPPGNMPNSMTNAYKAARAPAIAVFNQYAGGLFRALALVEMAWTALLLLLERSDLQSWTAGMLRRLLVLFAFLWLLQNGVGFSDRIMNSFIQIGSEAAAMPVGASPGDIVFRGAEIAENLVLKADITGFLISPAPTLVIILAAIIVFVSFVVVAIHFIMALVESYIVVSAGLIFLGFGGNSVTRPYVERYFALSVAVGVKLMILYMVVGIGTALSTSWAAQANNISNALLPFRDCFDLIGGSLIFAAVAWGVPKFAAAILAGSPSFTGGDIISMGMSTVQAGLMVAGGAALATRGAAMVLGGGAARLAAASSVGGAAGGSAGAAGGGSGGGPGSGGGGGGRPSGGAGGDGGGVYSPSQPAPPSGGSGSNGSTASSGGANDAPVSRASSSEDAVVSRPSGQGSAPSATLANAPPMTDSTAAGGAGASSRPANQVEPPTFARAMGSAARGAKAVESAAGTVQNGVQRAAMLAFFLQRIVPPEGGGGGTPPPLNMQGE